MGMGLPEVRSAAFSPDGTDLSVDLGGMGGRWGGGLRVSKLRVWLVWVSVEGGFSRVLASRFRISHLLWGQGQRYVWKYNCTTRSRAATAEPTDQARIIAARSINNAVFRVHYVATHPNALFQIPDSRVPTIS